MINKNNVEEYILFDVDGELSSENHNQLINYLNTDANAKQAWQNLLESKLIANENIVFKNKSKLLKTNTNASVFAFMQIKNLKIAAAIGLVIGTAAFFIFKSQKNNNNMFVETQQNDEFTIDTAVKQIAKNNLKNNLKNYNPIKTIHNNTTQNIVDDNENNYTANSTNNDNLKPENNLLNNGSTTLQNKNNSATTINNTIKNKITNATNNKIISSEKTIVLNSITSPKNIQFMNKNKNSFLETIDDNLNIETIDNEKIFIENKANANKPTVQIEIFEPDFLNNNKAYLFIKKASTTVSNIIENAKDVKQNGLDIEIETPNILNKKSKTPPIINNNYFVKL